MAERGIAVGAAVPVGLPARIPALAANGAGAAGVRVETSDRARRLATGHSHGGAAEVGSASRGR